MKTARFDQLRLVDRLILSIVATPTLKCRAMARMGTVKLLSLVRVFPNRPIYPNEISYVISCQTTKASDLARR